MDVSYSAQEIGKHGLSYKSFLMGKNKKDKNMDIILKEEELMKAVVWYLKPKMVHHTIEKVFLREVRIDNKKTLEVIARLKENEVK